MKFEGVLLNKVHPNKTNLLPLDGGGLKVGVIK
jgi:hypothetical protein